MFTTPHSIERDKVGRKLFQRYDSAMREKFLVL